MEWTPGEQSEDLEDRRGDSGGGGGFGIGGGGGLGIVGVIVLLVISLVTGRNYIGAYLTGGGVSQPTQSQTRQASDGPVEESAAEKRDVQLVSYVLDDVQRQWAQILPAQTGKNYRKAHLVLFRGETDSACGTAQSATGPFYCPGDEKVYIDLDFWDDLKRLGGDTGDFAQSYVIAHEFGHHIQKILGTEARVQQGMRDPAQRSALSVALELQADCYAGVWGYTQQQRGKLDANDVDGALKSAAAVGDDHIQKASGRAVSPESWTHGSSASRIAWFKRGMESGQVSACNTFGGNTAE